MVKCPKDDKADCCGKCKPKCMVSDCKNQVEREGYSLCEEHLKESIDDMNFQIVTPKIVAVIPVHGRLPLIKHTVSRLLHKNKVDVVCVGDGKQEQELCVSLGAYWINSQNKPLGRKWNRGFKMAHTLKADAVLFIGSSDWISDNWCSKLTSHLQSADIIGTAGCHFLHVNSELKLCHWPGYDNHRKGESIGIGRLISARVLDKLNWEPFDDIMDSSLDHSMVTRVKKAGGKEMLVDDKSIQSVSISTDLWPNKHRFLDHWNNLLPSRRIKFPENWTSNYFPEVEKFQSDIHVASARQSKS
jgi:glycosyltransferase involved in cell wall biosynthesis